MLTMVIAKPIQLTIVREVPLDSSGAFNATRVENIGESAVANQPQKNKKARNKVTESFIINKGEQMQHRQDKLKAMVAIFLGPIYCESNPPVAQDIPPMPMIQKDKSETLKFATG